VHLPTVNKIPLKRQKTFNVKIGLFFCLILGTLGIYDFWHFSDYLFGTPFAL
jgi:hypothetical protein